MRSKSGSAVFGSRVFSSRAGAPIELLATGTEAIRVSDFGGLESRVAGAEWFLWGSECAWVGDEELFVEAAWDGSV